MFISGLFNRVKERGMSVWQMLMKNKILSATIHVMGDSFKLFMKHDVPTLGAALSYYMIFSFAPLLLIVVSVVGSLFGPAAIEGEVKSQLQHLIGSQGAGLVESILKDAYHPGKNWFITTVAVVVLLIGATSVFSQLRDSLNTIWEVKPHAKKAILRFFLHRLFSFAMIFCLSFMLLVSLIFHAALGLFTNYLNQRFPQLSVFLLQTFNLLLSFALTLLLFALVYKFMSDARLKWKNIWWGALFAAVLFAVGKHLIGIYLGTSTLAKSYGGSSSVVILLVWVFYSSQILFFGAEFTRALATQRGIALGGSDTALVAAPQTA
jgi:membrane protein